jgi:hypothetical protein
MQALEWRRAIAALRTHRGSASSVPSIATLTPGAELLPQRSRRISTMVCAGTDCLTMGSVPSCGPGRRSGPQDQGAIRVPSPRDALVPGEYRIAAGFLGLRYAFDDWVQSALSFRVPPLLDGGGHSDGRLRLVTERWAWELCRFPEVAGS